MSKKTGFGKIKRKNPNGTKKEKQLYQTILVLASIKVQLLDDFKSTEVNNQYCKNVAIPFYENFFEQIFVGNNLDIKEASYVQDLETRIFDILPENDSLRLEIVCKCLVDITVDLKITTKYMLDFKKLCENLINMTPNIVRNIEPYKSKVDTIIRKNYSI